MKKISRRQFLKGTLTTGAMLAAGGAGALWKPRNAYAFAQSPGLKKFIQPLRNPLTGGIPVAASDGTRTWGSTVASHYTIDIGQFADQLHPDLANPTRLWGFGQGFSASNSAWTKHLGGVIVARAGTPVQITFRTA